VRSLQKPLIARGQDKTKHSPQTVKANFKYSK